MKPRSLFLVVGDGFSPTNPGPAPVLTLASWGLLLALISLLGSCARAEKPNLLLVVADDMGYGDLGCMGSRLIATPNLDALAQAGVLCKRAYVASSVCSPSRAGLMTGRDPRRFGYEGNLNESAASYPTRPELLGLPPNELTLGDHLRGAGYATALVGKWHLGIGAGFHPNARGFDHFCGMLGGGHTYFPQRGSHRIERNGEPVRDFSSPYLTDFFTDEAIRWVERLRVEEPRRPWLMVLSYNAPHTPMEATDSDLAACRHVRDEKRRVYAAMIRALDRGIGRVLRHLERSGQRERTLVVFLSDNGGATNNASWNGPLSGSKGTLREGGVRVPMIWSWPETIPSGRVSYETVSSLDILPTFLAAADHSAAALGEALPHLDPRNRRRIISTQGEYDGRNLLPRLRGDGESAPSTLFWRLQGQAALLKGDRKLIRLGHRPAQLFNVVDDPAEADDHAEVDQAVLLELFQELGEWEASLPTTPLWDSSPYWWGDSARLYDTLPPRPEPR